jgi:hypothetical protein
LSEVRWGSVQEIIRSMVKEAINEIAAK